MWSVHLQWGVVSAGTARGLGQCAHNGKGNSSHCAWGGRVGPQMESLTVFCRCDNAAIVSQYQFWQKQSGQHHSPDTMSVHILGQWDIQGVDNGAADALSRNDLPSFQSRGFGTRSSQREPSILPAQLLRYLVSSTPDWTQADRIKLFSLFWLPPCTRRIPVVNTGTFISVKRSVCRPYRLRKMGCAGL